MTEENYKTIADIMTIQGDVTTRASVRHSAMSAFSKFAFAYAKYSGHQMAGIDIDEIARNSKFQEAVRDLLTDIDI